MSLIIELIFSLWKNVCLGISNNKIQELLDSGENL